MLLSHIKRLCILLPCLVTATPQHPSPTSSSLPAALASAVPTCAQPCLQSFINDQFPVACITTTINFDCLCSHYSISDGFSLGEVALGCTYASCSEVDNSTAAAAYNVCLGQRDAVMPTHSALTVTAASSLISRTSAIATSTKQQSILSTSSHLQSTPTPKTASTGSANADSVPTTTLAPSTSTFAMLPTAQPSAIAAQSASQSHTAPSMKPAQIAGLSVAAAATLILAVGLMVFGVCLRRRKEKRAVAEIISTEKDAFSPTSPRPRNFSTRLSRQIFPRHSSQRTPWRISNELALKPRPPLKRARPTLTLASTMNNNSTTSNQYLNPNTSIRTVRQDSISRRMNPPDPSSVHPALRPGAGYTNNSSSSNSSVPASQIGLAITAELPGTTVPAVRAPQPPPKPELKEQRPGIKRLSRPPDQLTRPDSVLTQDTVFEEDAPGERRRSSKLLPTPPVPIPPIRSFQPSKHPPAYTLNPSLSRPYPSRQPSSQQPELFLNIPVRHSRSQPMQMAPGPRPKLAPPLIIAPPPRSDRISSGYNQYKPTTNATNTLDHNSHDIPSYYFMTPRHSPKDIKPSRSPNQNVKRKDSPQVAKAKSVKSKPSSSTISPADSEASTNIRDSISSQTSFETADPNDSTPEDEDEDKQLDKLSPVEESPISNLRYPKVPRASNQWVPRSPHTPTSAKSDKSPRGFPEMQSLYAKRRGDHEALMIDSPLARGSPSRDELRSHMKPFRQHMRGASMESAWTFTPTTVSTDRRHTRAQSGQWPKSPAMYNETDFVRPLNVQSKIGLQAPEVDVNALKSPIWVPRLTPRREGDDLLIGVTYSYGGQ